MLRLYSYTWCTHLYIYIHVCTTPMRWSVMTVIFLVCVCHAVQRGSSSDAGQGESVEGRDWREDLLGLQVLQWDLSSQVWYTSSCTVKHAYWAWLLCFVRMHVYTINSCFPSHFSTFSLLDLISSVETLHFLVRSVDSNYKTFLKEKKHKSNLITYNCGNYLMCIQL